MTDAVKKIMSHYTSDNPGRARTSTGCSRTAVSRDGQARHPSRRQGFEHGPARSFG